MPNMSLSFDGDDEYVSVPYNASLNSFEDGLTVTAWIKLSSADGLKTILENGNEKGFTFLVNPSGELYTNVQNQSGWSSIYSGATLALNQWYNVALTYSPGVIRLYIDGSLVNEGNLSLIHI